MDMTMKYSGMNGPERLNAIAEELDNMARKEVDFGNDPSFYAWVMLDKLQCKVNTDCDYVIFRYYTYKTHKKWYDSVEINRESNRLILYHNNESYSCELPESVCTLIKNFNDGIYNAHR